VPGDLRLADRGDGGVAEVGRRVSLEIGLDALVAPHDDLEGGVVVPRDAVHRRHAEGSRNAEPADRNLDLEAASRIDVGSERERGGPSGSAGGRAARGLAGASEV
jgi:hypothetical protein